MTQPATPTTWVPLGPDILTAITTAEKVTQEVAALSCMKRKHGPMNWRAPCLYLVYGEE